MWGLGWEFEISKEDEQAMIEDTQELPLSVRSNIEEAKQASEKLIKQGEALIKKISKNDAEKFEL